MYLGTATFVISRALPVIEFNPNEQLSLKKLNIVTPITKYAV